MTHRQAPVWCVSKLLGYDFGDGTTATAPSEAIALTADDEGRSRDETSGDSGSDDGEESWQDAGQGQNAGALDEVPVASREVGVASPVSPVSPPSEDSTQEARSDVDLHWLLGQQGGEAEATQAGNRSSTYPGRRAAAGPSAQEEKVNASAAAVQNSSAEGTGQVGCRSATCIPPSGKFKNRVEVDVTHEDAELDLDFFGLGDARSRRVRVCIAPRAHTHAHARTHARMHARTHTHTQRTQRRLGRQL